MAKSRTSFGNKNGPPLAWKLDDRAGILKGDLLGFTAKANAQRRTIVRPLPEVEIIDGQPVIHPMRMEIEGEMSPTYFFEKVTVAELGRGSDFTTFIADPSDAPEDMKRSDYPVMKLRDVLENAIQKDRAEWAMKYASWFMPHGKYDSIDFDWPIQYTVLQVFSYLQPGCVHEATIKEHSARLAPHPEFGYMLAQPEKKFMFIKGSGVSALDDLMMGQNEETGQYHTPADLFAPGRPMALLISGDKYTDEEKKEERSICTVNPYNLAEHNMYVPTAEDIIKFWTPWDQVFIKMTYDEQIQKLIQLFDADLINRVFNVHVNATSAAGPVQTSAPGPGAVAATAPENGWEAPAPADKPTVTSSGVAMSGWDVPASDTSAGTNTPASGASASPAGSAVPSKAGPTDATSTTPETKPGSMSPEAMKERFQQYQSGNQQGPK